MLTWGGEFSFFGEEGMYRPLILLFCNSEALTETIPSFSFLLHFGCIFYLRYHVQIRCQTFPSEKMC